MYVCMYLVAVLITRMLAAANRSRVGIRVTKTFARAVGVVDRVTKNFLTSRPTKFDHHAKFGCCFSCCVYICTRSSADADKSARRIQRSVKVTKHSTIPYVRYFSSCAIVTLSLRRAVFPIFDFKNAVTLKTGLGSIKVIGNVTMR